MATLLEGKPMIKTNDYSGECRRHNGNGDGHKLMWITMTSSCGIVFIGFMAWMTSMNTRLTSIDGIMALRGERVAALESVVKETNNRLSRMEDKIDLIVERQAFQKSK